MKRRKPSVSSVATVTTSSFSERRTERKKEIVFTRRRRLGCKAAGSCGKSGATMCNFGNAATLNPHSLSMKCIYAICHLMPKYKSRVITFLFLSIWPTGSAAQHPRRWKNLKGKQKDILSRGFMETGICGISSFAATHKRNLCSDQLVEQQRRCVSLSRGLQA